MKSTRTLLVGVGCRRGTEPGEVIDLVVRCLAQGRLDAGAIAALATIEGKAAEPALHAAAAHFGVPLIAFSAAELGAESACVAGSAITQAAVGAPAVAEAAALKAGELVVGKISSAGATCAIGRANASIDPRTLGRVVPQR